VICGMRCVGLRWAEFIAPVGREHSCVVADGLHAASLAKQPASLLLRRTLLLRNARGLAISRRHPRARATAHPERRRNAPPHLMGGPDRVDLSRFSDLTAPQPR
jgi:hypothetical protein